MMQTWKKLLTALPLTLCVPVALAETFNIVVVDGIFSLNPEPFESAELETAALNWLKVLDRVIYSPEPLYLALADTALDDDYIALGTGIFPLPIEYPEQFGLDSTLSLPDSLPIVLGADTPDNKTANVGIDLSPSWDWDVTVDREKPTELFYTLAHEVVHALGFTSGLADRYSEGDEDNGSFSRAPFLFDKFIVSSGKALLDMTTNEERNAVFSNAGNVVFSGPVTNLYAASLLTFGGGAEGVQLNASTTYSEVTLSHFSSDIDPDVLMEPSGDGSEMFTSFAVLSDLGYGDMLDTQVALQSSSDDSLVLAVKSETLQSIDAIANIVLHVPAVEGLTLAPTSGAACAGQVGGALLCTVPSFDTNADHLIGFDASGVEGVHSITIDVEHRALHVDADPLNNFLDVEIQVGTNPITEIALSTNTVDEGSAAGAAIGDLSVTSSSSATVIYELVAGEGDSNNSDITLTNGQILTAATLDHERLDELTIRVRASMGNGFTFESPLTIAVNDTNTDGCLNNAVVMNTFSPMPFGGTVAYASAGSTVSVSMMAPVMLWIFNLLGLGFVKRSKLSRRWKLGLMAVLSLSLMACGGGGGGGVAAPQAC